MKIQPRHITARLIKNSLQIDIAKKYAGIEGILGSVFIKRGVLTTLFPIDALRKNTDLLRCISAKHSDMGVDLVKWELNSDIYESYGWKEAEQEVIAEYMEEMEAAQKALQSVVEKYTYK
tara:strand:+ start:508 stop:867 length:360 start_codon:yes stop_codon:yes gene_type:complete